MSDDVFFSILIPNYGYDSYLKHCLDTVVNQQFSSFCYEIIIYDQSEDVDFERIKELVNAYSFRDKISLFHSDEKHVLKARHALIKKARGKYLCFIDSDDFIGKNYLNQIYLRLLKEEYPDILIVNITRCNQDGSNCRSIEYSDSLTNNTVFDYFLFSNSLNSIVRKIFKKELYNPEDYFDFETINGDDWVLSLPIMQKSSKTILALDINNYFYRENSNSITHSVTLDGALQQLFYRKRFYKKNQIENSFQSSLFIKAAIENFQNAISNLIKNKLIRFKRFLRICKQEKEYINQYDCIKNPLLLSKKQRIVYCLLNHHLFFSLYFLFRIKNI